MPFPPRKRGMDVMIAVAPHKGGPPPLGMPGRKPEAAAGKPPEPEAEVETDTPTPGLDFDAIGQKLGVEPDDVRMVAKAVLEHLLEICGGEEREPAEPNESDTENYPA